MLEANTRKERGRFATHTALTPHTVTALLNFALFFVFVVFFCPGDSLPPMSAVNGFDHDRAPQRHSTAFSDLDDDEEEDYPREVGLASLFFCHHVIDFSLSLSLSPLPSQRVLLDRSIGKLGLSIAGGADHISHVFGLGRPGIYISKVSCHCCSV